MPTNTFTDICRIFVKGGDGGAGCTSFRREAYVPKGGPDGGDGGHGANIILRANPQVSSLVAYRFKHHFKAERGTHGQGARKAGSDGKDMVLDVPLGTVVREVDSKTKKPLYVIADMCHAGMEVVVAKGGVGGRGNIHFVTSVRRSPAFSEKGEPAREHEIELEMKLLADAALVGMPSVGKSSIIARISAARPKIADYPFTTLTPNLGMVRACSGASFVVADVPGLIEGASCGKGLGHQFLRHIERSAVILHVVDMTGGFEGRDPVADYHTINNELAAYAPMLAERTQLVIANKCDMLTDTKPIERLRAAAKQDGFNCIEMSALTGMGVDAAIETIAQVVSRLRPSIDAYVSQDSLEAAEHVRFQQQHRERIIHIAQESTGIWRVSGELIERMVIQTDWDNDEALMYLQHRFDRLKLEDRLLKAGAHKGDEIRILGYSFTFETADDLESEFANECAGDDELDAAHTAAFELDCDDNSCDDASDIAAGNNAAVAATDAAPISDDIDG